jgi:two-component system sensor histidine kinase KdpD
VTDRSGLRIYVGAVPGVGKTYAMLAEGHRRKDRGSDVVVAAVDARGRPKTAELLEGLEVIPTIGRDVDVDAVLHRGAHVVLVDDLGVATREVDIDRLLDAGMEVVANLDLRHLERMRDVVFTLTGVVEPETVPDEWVRSAGQVELVDFSPEALRKRITHGNVVPVDDIEEALAKRFRLPTLTALRQLALLWVAGRVEDDLEELLHASGIDEVRAAKLLAYLHAAAGGEGPPLVVTEHFALDFAARTATAGGVEVRLTPTEWHLIEVLVCNRGRLVEQEDLLKEVWGPGYDRETNYLRVYLHQIRKKLEANPSRPVHFITEPGIGYRFDG